MKRFSPTELKRLIRSKQRDANALKDALSLLEEEWRPADRPLLFFRFLDFSIEVWHQIDFDSEIAFIHCTNMDIVPVLRLLAESAPLTSEEIDSLRNFCLNSEPLMLSFVEFLIINLAKRKILDPSVLLVDILQSSNGPKYAENLLRSCVVCCPKDAPDALLERLLRTGSKYTAFLVKLCNYLKYLNNSATREALITEFASWATLPDFEHFTRVVDLVGISESRENGALPRLYLKAMLTSRDFRNVELLLPLIKPLQTEEDFAIARCITQSSNRAAAQYLIDILEGC